MDENTPCKYDWDDLDVGKFDVNHSEKFFKFRHFKHEKLDENINSRKELYGFPSENEKENDFNALNYIDLCGDDNEMTTKKIKDEYDEYYHQQQEQLQHQMENHHISLPSSSPSNRNAEHQSVKSNKEKATKLPNILCGEILDGKKVVTLRKDNNHENNKKVPRAYIYNEIYKKSKEQMIQRLQEEDKKQRIFHSKPAPKYDNNERKTVKKHNEVELTVPITPMVLKKSKELEAKRKKKIEEYEKKMQKSAFTSREPHVLYEEPFKPKKLDHATNLRPFNLHVQKRLEERKMFDEKIKKNFEEKKKQEEEKKAREEKELVKEIRKLTTFKARPNPFK